MSTHLNRSSHSQWIRFISNLNGEISLFKKKVQNHSPTLFDPLVVLLLSFLLLFFFFFFFFWGEVSQTRGVGDGGGVHTTLQSSHLGTLSIKRF